MPRSPRFFISPDQISGLHITISGEDFRHIVVVLRMKTGDELLLCDGQGIDYTAKITHVGQSEIKTEITSHAKRESEYPLIVLGQGLPKSDKMDFIVQKATELGVSTVVPIVTERTIVKVKDEKKRISRWQRIAREAAMQSNRPDIPVIHPVWQYSDFILGFSTLPGAPLAKRGDMIRPPVKRGDRGGFSSEATLLLLPWEDAADRVKKVLRQNQAVKHIVVLVGPEGGFSQDEAKRAADNGFHLVSLGPNILRTETAAVAVLSMIGYEYV